MLIRTRFQPHGVSLGRTEKDKSQTLVEFFSFIKKLHLENMVEWQEIDSDKYQIVLQVKINLGCRILKRKLQVQILIL